MNNQQATADELLGQTMPVEVETMTPEQFRRHAVYEVGWPTEAVDLLLQPPLPSNPVEIGSRVVRIKTSEKP